MTDRSEAQFRENLKARHTKTDRLFFQLLIVQWGLALALAIAFGVHTWSGARSSMHAHIKLVIVFGAVINALPLVLIRLRPGWGPTRYSVAVAQMLWSAVLISVIGGRIETHFHVFGSLAFLAFYRDWKVLLTATLVVATEHLSRGLIAPEAVFGIANPEWWRFLEHVAWVLFEVIVLVFGVRQSIVEMRRVADRETKLEELNEEIELRVVERTAQLVVANDSLEREMQSRLQAETDLRQAQKLESVGRLAAGVAHEINTPVQFVNDSIQFLRDATTDLLVLVDKLDIVQQHALAGEPIEEAVAAVNAAKEEADFEYLREAMPSAVELSLDGLQRVATIVRSMRVFAHPDGSEPTSVDLNESIRSTLAIAANEYKYIADVDLHLGTLPHVRCFGGDVNQAILNIIVNAAHAISDRVGADARGTIAITTMHAGDHVTIAISDTGTGIPDTIRDRIFDPFFTTKDVGKGTGQGLAIVRSVIVDKHHGSIDVTSAIGKGTTFTLTLPVDGPVPLLHAA